MTYTFEHPVAVLIRERMARLDLNNETLGEAVQVSHATVSRWKRGHALPSREQLIALEDALGFQPGDLTLLAGYTPRDNPQVERGEGTLTLVYSLDDDGISAKPGLLRLVGDRAVSTERVAA